MTPAYPADYFWLIAALAAYVAVVSVFIVLVARDVIRFLKRK